MSLLTQRSLPLPHLPNWNLASAVRSPRRVVAAAAKEVYPAVIALSIFGTLIAGVLGLRFAAWFIRFHH
jgi:hypothetical protein